MTLLRRLLGHRVLRRWLYGVALAVSLSGVVLSNAVPLWYRMHGERLLVVTGGSMAPKLTHSILNPWHSSVRTVVAHWMPCSAGGVVSDSARQGRQTGTAFSRLWIAGVLSPFR